MSKRESKTAGNPMLRPMIFSVVLSVLSVIILSALGGVLILQGVLPEDAMGLWASVAVFLAALVGPLPLIKAAPSKRLPLAYVILAAMLAVMLLAKWFAWPGEAFSNLWPLAAGFAGATLSGILCSRKPKRKRR